MTYFLYDHRFIDININDNESDNVSNDNSRTKSPGHPKSSFFHNFIHNSPKNLNTNKILRKTKSESLKSPALPVLTQSASTPIDYVPNMYRRKSPGKISFQVQNSNLFNYLFLYE